MANMVEVSIICGSASDQPVAESAWKVLKEHGISYDFAVISAHREPAKLDDFIRTTDCQLFIAIAGLSEGSSPRKRTSRSSVYRSPGN
jgi:5-(carboxyamino)imidazole ribonucleotide mutase